MTPNQVTTLRMATGGVAAVLFLAGDSPWIHWGAGVFLLSFFLDHVDGEVARLTGETSPFGHTYDRIADAIVNLCVFLGIGIGLADEIGVWSVALGAMAGAGAALGEILYLRMERVSPGEEVLHSWGGFQVDSAILVLCPMTWSGALSVFLFAAAVGSPLFALWALARYRRLVNARARTVSG
ncbi:MAG: CDP-alcohol phosphatidyltransferase family protein [Alphaproteobacteria bacterium]